MRIGYYPGCSLEKSAKEFDLSIRAVLTGMGVSLQEIPDWNCCGASPAHSMSEELSLALPYRNLVQAEEAGVSKILSPCPACYSSLKHTQDEVAIGSTLDRLRMITGREFRRSTESRHLLEFLREDLGWERLKSAMKTSLQEMKVVSYYGCLTRLPGVTFEDQENPVVMDEIISTLGGEALDWSHKTECCGASFSVSRTEIALRLVHSILQAAKEREAECIAVVCPLCQSNLDTRQGEVNKKYGSPDRIPILYISQLIGLTQGLGYAQLGMDRLMVSPHDLLLQKGIFKK
ncbi:MAG: CoB--CoM heterodisulfide reductase iron-sulfur subunit B family protein [Deltaproteobacteria bacterium]|nr:CoB--CoM heterodisulfide reductase iron-sulfur subunit B family protein [Deltaproteobacteria bacterium]